jgi:hypothetical protein
MKNQNQNQNQSDKKSGTKSSPPKMSTLDKAQERPNNDDLADHELNSIAGGGDDSPTYLESPRGVG